MGNKVLMPALVKLDLDEFVDTLLEHVRGRDFGNTYVVDVEPASEDTLTLTMDDNSQFEIICRKKIT